MDYSVTSTGSEVLLLLVPMSSPKWRDAARFGQLLLSLKKRCSAATELAGADTWLPGYMIENALGGWDRFGCVDAGCRATNT